MGLAQMSALTGGKKFKRPYVEEINARAQHLPALYAHKSEEEYRDKMHGLETQKLGLSQDALDAQKKAQKRANMMGYANMGLAGAFGAVDAYPGLKEIGKDVSDWLNPAETVSMMSGTQDAIKAPFESMGGPIDWMADTVSPLIKNIGGFAWDAGKGIYDSLVGDVVDWTSDFGVDDVIDFGW